MTYKIIVSKGAFSTVEEAAYGETKISWADSYADSCRACTECFCALDAKSVFETYKNVNVQVCDIADFSDDSDALIFLGDECARFGAEKYNLPYEKVTREEGFRIFGTEKDGKQIVLLHGDGRRGSVYAMDEYMEYHGIRFISPDNTSYCTELDKSENKEINIESAPSYRTREASSEFANDTSMDFLMWLFHNKYNFLFLVKFEHGELLQKLGLGVTAGGHAIWYNYMDINHEYPFKHKIFGGEGKPEDPYEVSPLYKGDVNGDGILTYGEAHPEWYAEIDGEHKLYRNYEYLARGYWTGDFICTSNEDATDEFVRLIVNALADGEFREATKFKLSTLDNGTWCECEKCKNAGSLSYRILMFAYKLDKAIKKATAEGRIKRRIAILTQAYHETLPPPDRALPEDFDYSAISVGFYVIERCYLHNIDDARCTETNKVIFDNLSQWSGGYYKGELLIGEYYNVSTFAALPFVLEQRIRNDIPVFYKTGAKHFVYLHMLARTWGVQALNNYLLKSMLWDVNCDCDRVVNEYFLARYGEDAEKMKAVYKEFEEAGANCKYLKHYQLLASEGKTFALSRCLNEGNPHFFPLKHSKLDYREDDYQAGPSLLETRDRFEKAFVDYKNYIEGKEKQVLIEDYEQFEYGVFMMNYLYYKALSMLKDDSEEVLEKVKFYKKKLKEVTRPLRGYDYGVRYENGLAATGDHEI